MSQLNIAHLYQESGLRFCEPQAAQLHIYHTLRGLQRAGHQAALLALQGRRVLYTQDLQVFKRDDLPAGYYAELGLSGTALFKRFESGVRRIQSELSLPYLALFDSYRMAEAGSRHLRGFDLIHERFNLLALGGVWASKRLGIPYVLEVNADLLEQRRFKGVPEKGLRRLFAIWATRTSFKAAAQIICISEGLKAHLRRRWAVAEGRLAVLPCAADVEAFRPQSDGADIRRGLGLAAEPVVIWVGGFYPWHDLDLLLASFAEVRRRCPPARLLLVGDGPTRPQIAQRVRASGLEPAVIMTGAVAHSRVPEMLAIADVAAAPAAPVAAGDGGTGTPLKLFEYMAAGKAIVATAVSQAAEVIQDGRNGRLAPAGSVAEFADAVLALLGDPVERNRLGESARRHAIEHFSWERYTRRLEEIYKTMLSSRAPASATAQRA